MRLGYRIRDNYLRWCNIVHQVPPHKQAYATPYLVHILFHVLLLVRLGLGDFVPLVYRYGACIMGFGLSHGLRVCA